MQELLESLSLFTGGTHRVRKSQLVALTEARRGALQSKVTVNVSVSPTAAAGIANLARGGRGGTSLPPERVASQSNSLSSSRLLMFLLIALVGVLSLVLGYVMHRQ